MKRFSRILAGLALVLVGSITLAACGSTQYVYDTGLYTIDFGGNVEDESYSVAASTWKKSSEEGYEAVFTLTGTIAYDKDTADAMGYTDGRVNFVLIRFTSDTVNRVSYDSSNEDGFYCKITNFVDTENESVSVKHGGFSSGNAETSQNTYFLYQGVDSTVRTLTLEISFDGTTENARLFKFVIDPANYTLEAAPEAE